MQKFLDTLRWTPWLLLISIMGSLYFATHIPGIDVLPVFADEAIYIRWTQLAIEDPARYIFFPLNDGKTPLWFWSMIPLQLSALDPLVAARLTAVLVGALQVVVMALTAVALADSKANRVRLAAIASLITSIVPFWYFHHRMALTDGMTALWASAAVLCAIVAVRWSRSLPQKIASWGATGFFLGLGILTKIPAILVLPALALIPLIDRGGWKREDWIARAHQLVWLGGAVGIALLMFISLRISPAFGQLFARGSDFLYPVSELLFDGRIFTTLARIPEYIWTIGTYMTWPVMLLHLAGLFAARQRRIHQMLFWSSLAVVAPIALMGKIVYPRYFLLTAIFITPHVALTIEHALQRFVEQESVRFRTKAIAAFVITSLMAFTATGSVAFMYPALNDASDIPFTKADTVQYLGEWSSGHGIREVVELIQDRARTQTVAVATEGSFGTLPDGILLYLHNQDVSNLYVEGIGQPVRGFPDFFVERASEFDQTLLVVNSHRLKLDLPDEALVAEYCRPNEAPCLQVWDVTERISSSDNKR